MIFNFSGGSSFAPYQHRQQHQHPEFVPGATGGAGSSEDSLTGLTSPEVAQHMAGGRGTTASLVRRAPPPPPGGGMFLFKPAPASGPSSGKQDLKAQQKGTVSSSTAAKQQKEKEK